MAYVLDFTSREFVGHKFEHSRDIGLAALLYRCRDGLPALVVDSPRELRQLRAKARCCVDGQPIA